MKPRPMSALADFLLIRKRRRWETELTLDDCREVLVRAARVLGPWDGVVGPRSFELTRRSYFVSPSRPVVVGTLLEGPDGTAVVEVVLRPRTSALLFPVAAGAAFGVFLLMSSGPLAGLGASLTTTMFFWLLIWMVFHVELGATERLLREQLPPKPAPAAGDGPYRDAA